MTAHFRLSTITPVRAPINLESEDLAGFDFNARAPLPLTGAGFDTLFSGTGKPAPLAWAYGYGSLENDLCPRFFRPLFKRELEFANGSPAHETLEAFCTKWALNLACAELYIFDDTLALLRLDFDRPRSEAPFDLITSDQQSSFDAATSALALTLYHEMLYPDFVETTTKLEDIKSDTIRFRKQAAFDVFNDIHFDNKEHKNERHVLWTGRTIIVPEQGLEAKNKTALLEWAACKAEDELQDVGFGRAHIGSGNCLLVAEGELDFAAREWFRAQSLCQFYNAILATYNAILKSILLQIGTLEKRGIRKGRRANALLQTMTKRLDHLSFASMEFGESRRGAQRHRRLVLENTITAWELDGVAGGALEMAEFARKRLERLESRRRSKQNRSIELILTAIGGVAVIDLFLSLADVTHTGTLYEDGIPGVLDAFAALPPDSWIWAATTIVLLITLSVYRGRR
ncbi:hypothetical protein [Kordiimonas sp.]|uniref:hypothetical protein n=1 Tax=Kordiimonas sp. TaxID=1970157 RepID=UPI003A922BAD